MSGPEVPYSDGSKFFKTLDLLKLYDSEGAPVFFIVDGLGDPGEENPLDDSYLYDEHACPTNFIRIEAIFTREEDDPHGIFDYVRSVWMPSAYLENPSDSDSILRKLFPETWQEGPTIDGTAAIPIRRLTR